MNNYQVVITPKAYRDIDGIYAYIKNVFREPQTALRLIDEIETAVMSLETMPGRGVERKTGLYANKQYRQLFVKNYVIVYRVEEEAKRVVIVTVQYSGKNF